VRDLFRRRGPNGLGTYFEYPGGAVPTQVSQAVPVVQSDNTPVTPTDDAQSSPARAPGDGFNPYLVPDGFSYLTNLKYLAYRSFPMQLRLLDTLRRETLKGMWQPRMYGIPQDPTVTFQGGDTLNYELHVARGSILWGFTFSIIAATPPDVAKPNDVRIRITDICANRPIVPQYVGGSFFTPNSYASPGGGTPNTGIPFVLATEPIPISGSGDLMIDMVNITVNVRQCQLLMMFAEPIGSPQ
jgi:hypothetical protein